MQSKLQAAINQLCAEKNIDKEIVTEAVETAITAAYKRDFGSERQQIKVQLGDNEGEIRIFEVRKVVDKVVDHELEISLKDAKKFRPDAEIDMEIYALTPPHPEFGRIAAATAKQIIMQQIQEAEREMLFHRFKDEEGRLLTARVQKGDGDAVLLDIDGVAALLTRRGVIPYEKYFTGKRLKVLLEKVESSTKGPQLRLTRASEEFVAKLFEQEIPELREGTVGIKRIAREAGVRTKIAVMSKDSGVDPVGAFVGQRGSRINAVQAELEDERVDIVPYLEDKKAFLLACLNPAKVSKVEVDSINKEERVRIIVREGERALCIGKKGQNVRLAGILMNMQIDVLTFEGPDNEDEVLIREAQKTAQIETNIGKKRRKMVSEEPTLDKLESIPKATATVLMEMGLSQIKQYEGLTAEDLIELGITLDEAKVVMKAVNEFMMGE